MNKYTNTHTHTERGGVGVTSLSTVNTQVILVNLHQSSQRVEAKSEQVVLPPARPYVGHMSSISRPTVSYRRVGAAADARRAARWGEDRYAKAKPHGPGSKEVNPIS